MARERDISNKKSAANGRNARGGKRPPAPKAAAPRETEAPSPRGGRAAGKPRDQEGAGRPEKAQAKPSTAAKAKAKPSGTGKARDERAGRAKAESASASAATAADAVAAVPRTGRARKASPPAEPPAAAPRPPARGARKVSPSATSAAAAPQPSAPAAATPKAAQPVTEKAPPIPAARGAGRGAKPAAEAPAGRVAQRRPRARKPRVTGARPVALTEEEQIESAKYLPRELPPRVFEEERFIFPESYGVNRLRLLVKDPQWLFAYWDVDPAVLSRLRSEVGERAAALSRLTLKVHDPEHGGGAVIHLPEGVRSWYVRADRARRSYRAELGLTLPSGEYRPLAQSNTVTTPRVGASPRGSTQRARYRPPERSRAGRPLEPVAAAREEGARSQERALGPWQPRPAPQPPGAKPSGAEHEAGETEAKGGASDIYRR